MYIYRLETIDRGIGPYTGNTSLSKHLCKLHGASCQFDTHPAAFTEFTLFYPFEDMKKYHCCFTSFDRFVDWFGDAFDLFPMYDSAFHMSIYKIFHGYVREAVYQDFFRRDLAVLVDSVRLTDVCTLAGQR